MEAKGRGDASLKASGKQFLMMELPKRHAPSLYGQPVCTNQLEGGSVRRLGARDLLSTGTSEASGHLRIVLFCTGS